MENPNEFGISKEKIRGIQKEVYEDLLKIKWLIMKRGWCRVALGEYSSIHGTGLKKIHKVAKILSMERPAWIQRLRQLDICEINEKNLLDDGIVLKSFDNRYDIDIWIKSSSPEYENIGKRRTDIGKTMARFR